MISVLYNIILITNFKLIEMYIKSSIGRGVKCKEGNWPHPQPLPHRATLYTHLLGSYKRQLDVQKSVVLSLL